MSKLEHVLLLFSYMIMTSMKLVVVVGGGSREKMLYNNNKMVLWMEELTCVQVHYTA